MAKSVTYTLINSVAPGADLFIITSWEWLVDGQIESGRKPLAWEVVRQAKT